MCMFVLCYLFSMIDALIQPFQRVSVCAFCFSLETFLFCVLAFERIFLMFCSNNFVFFSFAVVTYIHTDEKQTQKNKKEKIQHDFNLDISGHCAMISIILSEWIRSLEYFWLLTTSGNDSHFSNDKDMKGEILASQPCRKRVAVTE